MTSNQIRALRRALGEDVETFGRRFLKSGRTIENWEQGRRGRGPDALTQRELARLAKRHGLVLQASR
jgi:DNA-binding transcriptional regulator YiaG